jgi:NADPH-dependent glutamate synthase beta subunit-like oxidoreductase
VVDFVSLQVDYVINFTGDKEQLQPPSSASDAAAKPTGRVIVVGAGPAGLSAANVLKVRLPQRGPRAGARVHGLQAEPAGTRRATPGHACQQLGVGR